MSAQVFLGGEGLALKGQTKTEGLSKAQAVKRLARSVPEKDTAAMVDYVRDARPFAQITEDALGLRSWLDEAECVPEGDHQVGGCPMTPPKTIWNEEGLSETPAIKLLESSLAGV